MISDRQKMETLSNTPLFAGWDEVYLKDIADNAGIDSYQKGDVIFRQDTKGDRFYIIVEGNVIIVSPEDKSVLAEFVKGEMFGETAMLTAEEQKAIASANEDSVILSFPKDGIPMEEVFKNNPITYAQLLKSYLVMVSRRTRKANSLIKENSPIMQELQKQVYGDKLTGLLNKAYLEENIKNFMKSSFSLIMMKPDNFKAINDTYGHEKGDACLTFIGNHLSRFLDTDSVLIRYQGNEFAVLTPELGRDGAASLAEKIKAELENLDISPVLQKHFKLSMSLGVLLYPDTKIDQADFIKQCSEIPLIGRSRGGSLILFEEDINE
ncbi:GGDEF domain-containing protein [Treponema sp. OMZ 799]|uniref:GGDEF domain-containing protein n=1 Tax=unclassified Treponema TaxID=2638727 RepID=UPI0020A5BB44|nr:MULTISPECIES: GGDEF domain-containing protein [unclassified Treponema]UTC66446.1 GGDEF domain-containing protein [Treponema sp. OMZ 789]UTC69177.1 GGDEF domain-containing protein [Treponema sp. OMZ 790]UTC71890.1 GGDEF domain-containing protein [Treponema sp. OMZ 791]UTC78991.1 GGDEF domain-containing protein [Treponema sp. OMZ 799]